MILINLMPRKRCFRCKENKVLNRLSFYRSNVRYWQRECIECTRLRRAKWWQGELGKRSSANTKLKRRYGIDIEEYEEMVRAVDGKCQICGTTCSADGSQLAVDHDHKTGKIKGILCKACNIGLGNFRDNPELLQNAIRYLNHITN